MSAPCICKTMGYIKRDQVLNWVPERRKRSNIQFIILDKRLLIIDTKGFKENCALCNRVLELMIYGTWPNISASFDGDTDLPFRIYDYDVMAFIYTRVRNEPRFGPFIYGETRIVKMNKFSVYNLIIYSISGEFKQLEKTIYLTVDGKMAVCCRTANNNFIIVDEDGKIIDSQVSGSESNIFKVGNSYLCENIEPLRNPFWTYTTEPALKTKPALAAAE